MLDIQPHADGLSPALALRRLIFGHRITAMIAVAAQLRLADALGDSAHHVSELAATMEANPRALGRLLRALASIGIVEVRAGDRYALTSMGQCLREDAPESQRSWVFLESADFYQHSWSRLADAVRTGQPASEHALGMPFYRYMADRPHVGSIFQHAMSDASQVAAQAVAAAYQFPAGARVVDVGGGYGALLAAILRVHPTVQGVLFDRPSVVAAARARLESAGVLDRCELVGGDFFEHVPDGGDVYILSRILMDHDDAHSLKLLRTVHRAMAEHGKLLIVQQILAEDTGDPSLYDGVMSDLNMLVMLPGGERTAREYRSLLEAAGFDCTGIIPTRALMSIVEGAYVGASREIGRP